MFGKVLNGSDSLDARRPHGSIVRITPRKRKIVDALWHFRAVRRHRASYSITRGRGRENQASRAELITAALGVGRHPLEAF